MNTSCEFLLIKVFKAFFMSPLYTSHGKSYPQPPLYVRFQKTHTVRMKEVPLENPHVRAFETALAFVRYAQKKSKVEMFDEIYQLILKYETNAQADLRRV